MQVYYDKNQHHALFMLYKNNQVKVKQQFYE